nr:hypothetical protein Josef01_10c16_45 [uncultured archaeon]
MAHRGRCPPLKKRRNATILLYLAAGALAAAFILVPPTAYGQLQVRKDPAGTVHLPGLSDPFAGSKLAYPIFAVSATILAVGILYWKKWLPAALSDVIRRILCYEVSRRLASAIIAAALAVYSGYVASDFYGKEEGDLENVISNTEGFVEGLSGHVASLRVVKYFLLYLSLYGFGNIGVIPFLSGVALLVLIYLFTASVAKRRLAGLVAFFALLQSPLYLRFDTSPTYDYAWITFYLLSLYLLTTKRGRYFSPVAFVLSLFSKPLTAAYIPMVLFFIWRAEMPHRDKLALAVPYGLMLFALGAAAVFAGREEIVILSPNAGLLTGMISTLPIYLGAEYLFWLSLLPVYCGLFLLGLKRTTYGQSMLFLFGGTLASYYILEGFTNISSQPYRFVPLVVVAAIGLGALLSHRFENIPKSVFYRSVHVAVAALTAPPAFLALAYVIFPTQMTAVINQLARAAGSLVR